ncbi:uncharacterized protein [Rutidosis leptorrhynchoides]|uniref:uncharacterized protein n=1 Tax=Rutidosis leptorrhynchoides TaxID=125765 RepID=UPI003A9944B1
MAKDRKLRIERFDRKDFGDLCFFAEKVLSPYTLSNILNKVMLGSSSSGNITLLNKFLPQSLGVFVWRSMRGRLPVRLELDKRGVDLNSVRCPVCDNAPESVEHIILECNLSIEIWSRVRDWWNIPSSSVYTDCKMAFNVEDSRGWKQNGHLIWQAVR